MYNINFIYLVYDFLLIKWRKSNNISLIMLALSYIRKIWDMFVDLRAYYVSDFYFTGQTMYVEKKLSDFYNCSVLIEDGEFIPPVYVFNNIEELTPIYTLNTFNIDETYYLGTEILYNNEIYTYNDEGNQVYPNEDPSASLLSQVYDFMLYNNGETSLATDFIVKFPKSKYEILKESDFLKINNIIEFYKLAGKTFKISYYE